MIHEESAYRKVVDEYTDYLVGLFLSFRDQKFFDGMTLDEALRKVPKDDFLRKYKIRPEVLSRFESAIQSLFALKESFNTPVTRAATVLDQGGSFEDFLSQDEIRNQLECVEISRPWLRDAIAYDMMVVRHYLTPGATLLGLQHGRAIPDKVFQLTTPQIFDHYSTHPELLRYYGRGFASSHIWSDLQFIRELDFKAGEDIVDVGGCFGHLGNLILSEDKNVDYHCLDLSTVRDVFRPELNVSETRFGKRFQFLPGNFFDQSVPGIAGLGDRKFDKIFLGWILHDWDNDQCLEILRKCRRHLKPDGEIIVFEILPNERKMNFSLTNWLMLVMAGGFERTADQYNEIFKLAGLKLQHTSVTKTGRSMLRLSK